MGRLISARVEASTLTEYYDKLCALQCGRHGADYILVHDEIRGRLRGCDSYTEFGINQGATLAAALLDRPKTVHAYDIRLGWYTEAAHLFTEYAVEHGIDYGVTESDTADCIIDPVDVLYIDSLHEHDHLVKELAIHGDRVNRFIIIHDTHSYPELKMAVLEYVDNNKDWSVISECNVNVGFMTIGRLRR